MAFPADIVTRNVQLGSAYLLESGDAVRLRARIGASRSLVRSGSGNRFQKSSITLEGTAGQALMFELPVTDQTEWLDAATRSLIDVSASGAYTHLYVAFLDVIAEDGTYIEQNIQIGPFVLPTGSSTVDLDKMLPIGTSLGDQVLIPDRWSQILADTQQAVLEVKGVVASNDNIMTAVVNDEDSNFRAALNGPIDGSLSAYAVPLTEMRWQDNPVAGGGLILTEGDSLTEGAGGSNFRSTFEKSMRAAFGDGGPGLHSFDNGVASALGASFAKSGGMSYIAIGAAPYGSYFMRGLYSSGATGSDSFDWKPGSAWDLVRVLFLKQPSGGTFKVRLQSQTAASDVTVNTGTVNSDGSGGAVSAPAIGYFDVVNPGMANTGIRVSGVTGNVVVFAGDFKITSKPKGYRQGMLGQGGKTLQTFAGMDMTIRQQWLQALAPVAIITNLGMNDRATRSAAQHTADLTTLISANKAALPNAAQLIVMPNEPSDANTTNFQAYRAVKKAVARTYGAAFFDDRSVLGDYTTADTNGLMADGVHPSAKGNARRAAGYASALGVPVNLSDPGLTPYPGASGTSYIHRGALTPKRGTWDAATETDVVYTLGLTNGYPTAIFKLIVSTQRTVTNAGVQREFVFSVWNGTTLNAVTGASAVTTRLIHAHNAGDGQTLDVTATVAVVSGALEVRLTSGAYAGSYDVTGEYVFTSLNTTGQSVFER